MSSNDAEELIARMRDDMRQAMKNKNKIEVDELRSLIARISNAEALPIESGNEGIEMQRKQLSSKDIIKVITDEEAEIQNTILSISAQSEYVAILKEKLSIVRRYK